MKRMIRVAVASLLALSMAAVPFAASAAPAAASPADRLARLEQRQQQITSAISANQQHKANLSNREQYNQMRADLFAKRGELVGNRAQNLDVTSENNKLRIEIQKQLQAIKAAGVTVPEDTLTQVAALNKQIKDVMEAIKATQGQIKTLMDANKTAIKNKDYDAISANFQKIEAIQQWRHDQLAEINGYLSQILDLLKAVPLTAASSGSNAA